MNQAYAIEVEFQDRNLRFEMLELSKRVHNIDILMAPQNERINEI